MGHSYRRHSAMSSADLDRYHAEQARERQRRGLVGFTRPARAEQVYGRTPAENRAHETQRRAQTRKRR